MISTTIKQHEVRPVLQCMVIAYYREDNVCRECLAVHSVSLAIQTYFLHYKTKQSSAELCIFRTNYKTNDIVLNCKRSFCSIMIDWKPRDCDRMIDIFPMHHIVRKPKCVFYQLEIHTWLSIFPSSAQELERHQTNLTLYCL